MTHQTTVALIDDIDGGKAAETVAFALDGASYEIDLSGRNAKELRKTLAPFAAAGRLVQAPRTLRASGRRSAGHKGGRVGGQPQAAVREWALSQGIEVNPRGRIPAAVLERYEAAHAS